MQEKLARLNGLELHDCNVESLQIGFSDKSISISIDKGDDSILTLNFMGFRNFSFEGQQPFEDLEISSVNFSIGENAFCAEFVFLLGFGLPSCSLSFSFEDYEISI